MNPTDVLPSAARRAAEIKFCQPAQERQCATIAPEHKTDPQHNFACLWNRGRIEGCLPLPADFCERVFAGRKIFITDMVAGVAVKTNRACLHPDAWRNFDLRQRVGDGIDRVHARSRDFKNILRRVRAVYVFASEINDGFRAVDKLNPAAKFFSIPSDFTDAVGASMRRSRKDDNFKIACGKFLRQYATDEPAATRDDDAFLVHGRIILAATNVERWWRKVDSP